MRNALAVLVTAILAGVLSGCTSSPEEDRHMDPAVESLKPFPPDAPAGTVRVFARLDEPGDPEGIALRDGRVFISLSASNGSTVPELAVLDLATGEAERRVSLVVAGESREGRALGLARLDNDILVTFAGQEGRILRWNFTGTDDSFAMYASIPDLPVCQDVASTSACEPKIFSGPPCPNYVALDASGHAFVSDICQATIFRVAPGGGAAEVWYADHRFGAAGPNGLAVSPDGAFLYVAHTTVGPLTGSTGALSQGGAVWRLSLIESPSATDMELVRHYPNALIDGLAFGASGLLYVTHGSLAQGVPHGISVLDADGEEVAFYGGEQGEPSEVPLDFPANLVFHDGHRSLLVTNQAFGMTDHWAVLELFVDDVGIPLHDGPA